MLQEGASAPFFCAILTLCRKAYYPASQKSDMSDFRPQAPSAETVFLRTYSRRKEDGARENFREAMTRTTDDLAEIGKFTPEEKAIVQEQALAQHAFPSGRAFWVAGTEWGKKPENFSGYYNCTSTHIQYLQAFGCWLILPCRDLALALFSSRM